MDEREAATEATRRNQPEPECDRYYWIETEQADGDWTVERREKARKPSLWEWLSEIFGRGPS
jgi:hypothetical protein